MKYDTLKSTARGNNVHLAIKRGYSITYVLARCDSESVSLAIPDTCKTHVKGFLSF